MNLGVILAEIRRSLKEPAAGGHWTDAELIRRVNIGHRKIVRFTKCLSATVTLMSVAGQGNYSKPADFKQIIRMLYENNRIYAVPVSDLDLWSVEGRISRPWINDTGTPEVYYETTTEFIFYPRPAAANQRIIIEYTAKPADLVATTDVPFSNLPHLEDYRDLIVSFVLWRCLLEDGVQLYAEHKSDFLQGIVGMKAELLGRPDTIQTFDFIGRRGGRGKQPLPFMR